MGTCLWPLASLRLVMGFIKCSFRVKGWRWKGGRLFPIVFVFSSNVVKWQACPCGTLMCLDWTSFYESSTEPTPCSIIISVPSGIRLAISALFDSSLFDSSLFDSSYTPPSSQPHSMKPLQAHSAAGRAEPPVFEGAALVVPCNLPQSSTGSMKPVTDQAAGRAGPSGADFTPMSVPSASFHLTVSELKGYR